MNEAHIIRKLFKPVFWVSVLLVASTACAQYRVVDSSQRRAPDWVNTLERDYIIIAAEGPSISDAQQNALMLIKERIVTSVADNVKAESELVTEEVNYNNNVTVFLEQYSATITTQSGDIPYLQGVSLSLAEGFYWEHMRDRSTGNEKYRYHVRYPFPEFELRKLVMEFQRMQRELTEQLEKLIDAVHDVNTIEQINNNISELQTLAASFIDRRKEQAQNGIGRYRELLNSLTLYEEGSRLGTLRFGLRAGDRFFTTAQRPNIRSECARITGTRLEGKYWVINYDTDYCYDDPENHIEVNYRFGTSPIRNRFYFNINEDKVRIALRDPIHFGAIDSDAETIHKTKLRFTVHSEHAAPFVIEELTLNFDNMPPIIIKNIEKRFSGSGNHNLTLEIDDPIVASATTATGRRMPRISGYLQYRSVENGEKQTYRIYNHPYTTSW